MNAADAPRPPLADRSARWVLAWVDLYTRGVASTVAAERRAEIEADLWDEAMTASAHTPPAPLASQRFSRLVRGVPADLAWRFDHRSDTNEMREIAMRPTTLEWVVMALAASLCIGGISVAVVTILNYDPDRWQIWVLYGVLVASIVGLIGLAVAIRRPGQGAGILAAGGILVAVTMPWIWHVAAFVISVGVIRWGIAHEGRTEGRSEAA